LLVGLLVKGFKMFMDIGFATDKQITDLSKSMSVSQKEAAATRDRFREIAIEASNSADQGDRIHDDSKKSSRSSNRIS
jgi:hypothetical protein